MSQTTENNILLFITGKQTPDDVSVAELAQVSSQCPSFGITRFLLAKKAKKENHQDSNKYAESAVLHFPNPYWFHFKLSEAELMKEESLSLSKNKPVPDINEQADHSQAGKPAFETTREENDSVKIKEEILAPEPGMPPSTEPPAERKVEIEAQPNETENHAPATHTEDEMPPAAGNISPDGNAPLEISTGTEEQSYLPEAQAVVTLEPAVTNIPGEVAPPEYDTNTSDFEELEEHPVETDLQPAFALNAGKREAGEIEADDTDGFEDADAENEAIMPNLANEKISSVLQEQLDEFKKPVAEDAPVPIETEPYHTVDYFASQGIKLSAELQKQDHLAVKVKKFTDWLKQMKRINPTPADLGIDEATEHKVQDSAASSNEAKEVVTEAMAEVLAMQGMTEKAIQVYIKLSFLDPSKTAYFASKIEKLKGM